MPKLPIEVECLKCKKRFTTYEQIDRGTLFVIKKDGTRERFDRDKVKKGIEKACEKRPVTHKEIENTVNEVEDALRKKGKKDIKSSIVGELIMKKLKKLDNVAYIRFASVYKEFQDIGDFRKEIREL